MKGYSYDFLRILTLDIRKNLHDWDTKLVSSYPFCQFRHSSSYALLKYKEHIQKMIGTGLKIRRKR